MEKDFVTENQCKERCKNLKGMVEKTDTDSKNADGKLEKWLNKLDGRLWYLVFQGFATLLAILALTVSVIALFNGGGP